MPVTHAKTPRATLPQRQLKRRRSALLGLGLAIALAALAWNLTRYPLALAVLWTGHSLSWGVAGLAALALAGRLLVSPLRPGRLGAAYRRATPQPLGLIAGLAVAIAIGAALDTLL
ncbi:hypothetical protein [Lacticaseibacillus suihuaensis]